MPHSRPRVWVRGLRVDCLPSPESQLPPPLCLAEVCQQKLLLTDFLEADLPNYDPSQLTATMRGNLALYKELAKEALSQDGTVGEVMAVELDRNPLRQYGGAVSFDQIPSLRTQGPKIFLVSLNDLDKGWDKQRFHRYLSLSERFLLQGHSAVLKKHFKTNSAATKASGNAFNVLQMACMLSSLLEAAARTGALTREGGKVLSTNDLCKLLSSQGPPQCPVLQRSTAEPVSGQKRKRVKI